MEVVRRNVAAMEALPEKWKVLILSAGHLDDRVYGIDHRLPAMQEGFSTAG